MLLLIVLDNVRNLLSLAFIESALLDELLALYIVYVFFFSYSLKILLSVRLNLYF